MAELVVADGGVVFVDELVPHGIRCDPTEKVAGQDAVPAGDVEVEKADFSGREHAFEAVAAGVRRAGRGEEVDEVGRALGLLEGQADQFTAEGVPCHDQGKGFNGVAVDQCRQLGRAPRGQQIARGR